MEVREEVFESSELSPGDILAGKYLLLAPLAEGGMARVWRASNLLTGAEVAAKVLLPEHAATGEGVARFRREAQATARLSHRAIVRIFDLVELSPERGSLVMIMELLRGHTLASRIAEMGRLSIDETLQVVFPLLSALAHAHGVGIVHRDLKPENIFLALEPDGRLMPKVVDFGISKQLRGASITLDGEIVGTVSYMSPEQTTGAYVDQRSDIFSLGILLYECLSGANPFLDPRVARSGRLRNLMAVFDVEPAPLANVPAALWHVIRRALARDADDRFANVGELAEALQRAVPSPALVPDYSGSWSNLPTSSVPTFSGEVPAVPTSTPRRLSAILILAPLVVAAAGVLGIGSEGRRGGLGARELVVMHESAPAARAPRERRFAPVVDVLRIEAPKPTEPSPPSSRSAVSDARGKETGTLASVAVAARAKRSRAMLAAQGVLRDPGF